MYLNTYRNNLSTIIDIDIDIDIDISIYIFILFKQDNVRNLVIFSNNL